MIKLYENGVYLANGAELCERHTEICQRTGMKHTPAEAQKGTMAYGILKAHNTCDDHKPYLPLTSMAASMCLPIWPTFTATTGRPCLQAER